MTKEAKIERRNKIVKGLEKAYEKMLELKRKNNSEIVVIQENKIVKIKPWFLTTVNIGNFYVAPFFMEMKTKNIKIDLV